MIATRESLQAQRRDGVPFDRSDWPRVLDTTADAWRRAYVREAATRREEAVTRLLQAAPEVFLRETPVMELELATDREDPFEVAAAA